MSNQPTRLGVVGTGLIWTTTHLPEIEKLPEHYAVTALCARSETSRRDAAARCPGATIFDDYADLVRSDAIDAVVVCTPIAMNAKVAAAALLAGKDVFLEKPMATSVSEADTVIEAEGKSGRTVYLLEQMLFAESLGAIRDVIDGGEIGRLAAWDRITSGFIDTRVDPWGYGRTRWRVAGEFPLGPLFDGGIHEIALHSRLFGPVERVAAHGQSMRREHGEYDNVQMLFVHESGVLGMYAHSGYLGGSRNPFTIRGEDGLIAVEADHLVVEGKLGGSREIAAPPANLHERMWREFARQRVAGEMPAYSTRLARHDVAVLEAVSRSIRVGRETRVDA